MIKCTEFVLDDLMAITAIPVTDYVPGTASWQMTATIPSASFSPTLTNAIVIGQRKATVTDGGSETEVGKLIPIVKMTGKAKDQEGDSVAGRQHTVTVTCEVDDRDWSVWEDLLALERTPRHLLLTFRQGTRAFVTATGDTYLFETDRDGAKTTATFKIFNLMGIQLIIEQRTTGDYGESST